MDDIITLDYGSGGKKTSELIEQILLPAFSNNELSKLSDGAILNAVENIVFSTDSFVVSPIFFQGGDIGKLSVCGTVNDICVSGGLPKYLSLSLIIEEGFSKEKLVRIIQSIKDECSICGVNIVTGDTKVVEKGKCDGIYINTAGIGFLKYKKLGKDFIKENDAVIITGTAGDHGACIMAERNNLFKINTLKSDCAPLLALSQAMMSFGDKVRIMRDPTRGGVATTLNEFVENEDFGIILSEEKIPIKNSVSNICDIIGLDPLYCANEGRIVAVADAYEAEEIVNSLKDVPGGEDASVIGHISKDYPGRVVMKTPIGGTRILSKLTGAQLPRIC
jgi:hydrogenase expression/formation protein HypE